MQGAMMVLDDMDVCISWFVGEAINHRGPKFATSVSSKTMKKNMEKFKETGIHPDLERAHLDRMKDQAIRPLPDMDPNRPFVFMDINIGHRPAGRLVFELFEDMIPMGVDQLKNQLLPGSRNGLAGCCCHKLIPHYAAFFGNSGPDSSNGLVRICPNNVLRTVEAGTISVSFEAGEVVGRVHLGKEVLEKINETSVTPDDSPTQRIVVTNCGATNMNGDHEALEAAQQALQVGMGLASEDSKAGGAGPSGSTAARASGSGAAGGSGKAKSKMLDAMLGDLSGSDSDSSDEE
eukprot:gene32529-17243_t